MQRPVGAVAPRTTTIREPAWWQRKSVREGVWLSLIHAFLILSSLLLILPLYWLLVSSLRAEDQMFLYPPKWIPDPIVWDNWHRAFTGRLTEEMGAHVLKGFDFLLALRNTLIIVVGNMICGVTSSSLVAYSLSRLQFRGRDAIFYTVVGAMLLPGVATLIPRYVIFSKLGWVNTFLPLIVPRVFGDAFMIFFLRQFFLTIPLELEDAARIDGCGILRFWWRILLPLCRAAIVVQCIRAFIYHWNEFLDPLIYLQRDQLMTLQLAAARFHDPYFPLWGPMMAYGSVLVLPCLLVFFVAQRIFIQGIVFTGIKG